LRSVAFARIAVGTLAAPSPTATSASSDVISTEHLVRPDDGSSASRCRRDLQW
jgi:hypothetical protein